ncbi:MAG TPA: type I polyketide synthase [Chloroflexia bacterium]|nr:type I polyketide synthase [Chloroflexia bacterium]
MSGFEPEPIAIVGIGCRFPGGPDPLAFWKLLREGREAIREVPAERWDIDSLYDPDTAKPGKMMTRWGGFIDNVDGFDWRAFRIPPREVKYIDPQHRLLLEVAWEAFEDAGLPLEKVAGTLTGVFIGICWNDYLRLQARNWNVLDGYTASGNPFAFAANRLSYFFDLRGPSLAMDATCASSLASLNFACQSLWSGEVDMALAGGVNLMLSPDSTIIMSKAGILSPEGKVKALDKRADGFVRGEGGGIVVLKRQSDVLPSDKVYAYVRGVSVNHNGRNEWIMAPSQEAQARAIRTAYARAGVDPTEVDYVELHGTGFKRGDPIEVKALGEALGAGNRRENPIRLGSVKTNIGNLEAAAGIASLIKVALSLYYREIPPTLNLEEVNPEIPLAELGFAPQTTSGPWPVKAGKPTAGVTVVAFSGVNAHAVLEAAPVISSASQEEAGPYLLTLSARTPEALRETASRYKDFLVAEDMDTRLSLEEICYTAGVRRSHHEHRLAVVGQNRHELLDALEAYEEGRALPCGGAGQARSNKAYKTLFVFPGDGQAIGLELMAREQVFREVVEECDRLFRQAGGWSLIEELEEGSARDWPVETARTLPARFATQVALAALWKSWGVEPAAVAGQGAGEVAAACVAGMLSLKEAVEVIAFHSLMNDRRSFVQAIHPLPAALPFYGARAGKVARGQITEVTLWQDSIENCSVLDLAVADKYDCYLEIGISSPVRQEIEGSLKKAGQTSLVIPSLLPGRNEKYAMLSGLGKLYARGYRVDLAALWGAGKRCVTLPTYAWQRERFWLDGIEVNPSLSPEAPIVETSETEVSIISKLEAAPPAARREMLVSLVLGHARQVLELSPDQPLGPQQRLFDTGLDSLSAVQLRNRLQTSLERPLPAILVFDYPTVEALATFLETGVLFPRTATPAAEIALPGGQEWEVSLLSKITELSEDEAAAMLMEKLAALGGEEL